MGMLAVMMAFGGSVGCATAPPPNSAQASVPVQRVAGCQEPVHATFPPVSASLASIEAQAKPVEDLTVLMSPPSFAVASRDADVRVGLDLAREAGVEGTALVLTLVCEHGRAVQARVVKSIPILDAAALEVLRTSRFHPARSGGRSVSSWVRVPVVFQRP